MESAQNITTQEKTKICIVEDYQDLLDTLVSYLSQHSYGVDSYSSAEDFFAKHDNKFRGIYLIDWKLPGESGIQIIEKIREVDKVSPIFMMSAFNREEEILTGLKAGADDYITKPFNFEQLITKIDNAQKRFDELHSDVDEGQLQLIGKANAIIKDGVTTILTLREFVIFEYLYEHRGEAVSRDKLIEEFSNDEQMTLRNIDVHVFSLRKKINKINLTIETVRGVGYKFTGMN